MSEKQKSQDIIPREIAQLLEHRATLGNWLAKLEELSGTVRPEVYDRVRGDYKGRLRSQETELAAHRSEMEAALEERKARVAVLEADRDERAAELEEAELRFAVGEFKEAEFEKRKSAHEESLSALDSKLSSDQDALAKLQEVVGVLSSLREGVSERQASTPSPHQEEQEAAEEAEATWGTVRGRGEEGTGAVKATKSAAAASAVAVADARATEAAEEAPKESEEVFAEASAEDTADATAEEAPEPETPKPSADDSSETVVESAESASTPANGDDYLDDLEFLESLSMDEIGRLDAVSAILEEESEAERGEKGSEKSH
jgi:hypothetical protein